MSGLNGRRLNAATPVLRAVAGRAAIPGGLGRAEIRRHPEAVQRVSCGSSSASCLLRPDQVIQRSFDDVLVKIWSALSPAGTASARSTRASTAQPLASQRSRAHVMAGCPENACMVPKRTSTDALAGGVTH